MFPVPQINVHHQTLLSTVIIWNQHFVVVIVLNNLKQGLWITHKYVVMVSKWSTFVPLVYEALWRCIHLWVKLFWLMTLSHERGSGTALTLHLAFFHWDCWLPPEKNRLSQAMSWKCRRGSWAEDSTIQFAVTLVIVQFSLLHNFKPIFPHQRLNPAETPHSSF